MNDPNPERSPDEVRARKHAEGVLGHKLPATLHCSFCAKSQRRVEKLIAGPRVFICNECVGLCDQIIAGTWKPSEEKPFTPLERPTEELVELLPSVNFASEANRDFLQELVDALRKRKVSWAAIGEALGVSRQSAWERFS